MTRTTVITGAASGIGKATAARLRAEGQRVIGVDLRGSDVAADLSTDEGRATLVEQVSAASGGHVDAVIAVAGLVAPSPVTLSVNYFGATAAVEGLHHLLARSAAPRAVVVSSIAAIQETDDALFERLMAGDEPGARREAERIGTTLNASGGSPIYTTSKYALARWVRAQAPTAHWAGAGIALNAVAPGVTATPMTVPVLATAEGRATLDAGAPSPLNGPAAPPEAPAALLAWLASAENTHVTGQVIFIDGGAESIHRPDSI
ncbi:SDR family oxidoreductase [Cellulomonas sp. NS3]|uniref:SDR family oxidoreductase n=1 Tax=Cellulomonas sp. NS3 TaxID=2973977 RepID=UPI00216210D9|nr:SDR family oxidoreductase [Cellulomonas sp. NS3]